MGSKTPSMADKMDRVLRTGLLVGLLLAASMSFGEAGVLGGEAVSPGDIETRPTWSCMGINWHFQGDENRNASVGVLFRRIGETQWREALGLWRHEFEQTRMFSGSVFRLAPGTAYEFRLGFADPDGGDLEQIVKGATLDVPRLPRRSVEVMQGGLVEAQQLAVPGTVMLIHAGEHPATILTKSGRPGQWIVYRNAGDGEVVIKGNVRIEADDVWLHGLTLENDSTTIDGRGSRVAITNCKVRGHYAIHTPRGSQNYYISDNTLTGDSSGKFTFGGEGVDFGSEKGRCCHAVCFNEFSDFADGVSYGRGDIDVYNNFIHETVDDFIEPDYARNNYRLWNNRCYNSMCGFSFQPMKGGPWYIFNNINVGAYLHALKVKSITGPTVIYGNTFLTKSSRLERGGDVLRGLIVNNVWLRMTPGSLANGGRFRPSFSPTIVDYNAWGAGDAEPFSRIGYRELAEQQGWDKHSISVDVRKVFQEEIQAPAGSPFYSSKLQGQAIPKDWRFEHYLLTPREGSPLIDAGTVLPNLSGPYLGDAPDVGAHEFGLGTAWYGPRTWDEDSGLVYGIPDGWKKAPRESARDYSTLGCPAATGERDVLLVRSNPGAYALMQIVPVEREKRWERLDELVAADEGAATPKLEFQDGLTARLYETTEKAQLVAGRVQPDGVLQVTCGCRREDLKGVRGEMLRLIRSLRQ